MEHINTQQRSLGLKIPGFSIPEKLFSSGFDGIFTITMIIFGMVGCLYVLYLQGTSNRTPEEGIVLTASIPSLAPEAAPAVALALTESEQPKFVEIRGLREAGIPLEFVIDAFDKAADYHYDFGNGDLVPVGQSITHYTFTKPGVYQIKLNIGYEGEERVIDLGPVWIK